MRRTIWMAALVFGWVLSACGAGQAENDWGPPPGRDKADGMYMGRTYEVLLTEPHCDVCDADDKSFLLARSPIIARVIELLDQAHETVDIAQFTFSRKEIEEAVLAAQRRGVRVRMAMNHQQAQGDNVSTRLAAQGVDVRFIEGKDSGGGWAGLMHAKFMLVDGKTLLIGSNNWSSTGTSINEENTIVVHALPQDELLSAFGCAFEAIWEQDHGGAVRCSTREVAFTPGSAPLGMLKDAIRGAETSVEVLMHHLLFDDLVKVLAQAAERGVRVRVVVNAADREETRGRYWDRLRSAGGQVRYKQGNSDLYQLMHHKLCIVDGRILVNGSGNWSGSAFFNNFEFYVWHQAPDVVDAFDDLFNRLWDWSLTSDSLDRGLTAAVQDMLGTRVYFGNLHAHHWHRNGEKWLDDGLLERMEGGELVPVADEVDAPDGIRYAYRYARDVAGMDFLGISPHVYDDQPSDAPNMPSMSIAGYERILEGAAEVTAESAGEFLALASFEWNTNSAGNHVNVIGSRGLCKVERGAFPLFYEGFLPERQEAGDRVFIMLNHPRTFPTREGVLTGNWDQIYDVDLREIPKRGQRTKKFNDFGLDDYPPLANVRDSWIEAGIEPDPAVVSDTLFRIQQVTAPYARLMEVTLGRGTGLRDINQPNPDLVTDDETGQVVRVTKVHTDWDYYLLHGFRLAPAASHDNHYANWGMGHSSRTGVIVPGRLTRASMLDAIDRRAVFASEDQNLEVRLYAEDRVRAGAELRTLDDEVVLDLYLADPDYRGSYQVTVYRGTVGGDRVEAVESLPSVPGLAWQEIPVALPGPGTHFVYVEVHESSPDRMAWSAPVWVEKP